ncbi:MAG: enoyl-CoA hydratase-related protein [Stellaceae bacterium]
MPSVIVQRREAVLEILLNRPAVLNAANREMIGELAAAAADAAEDAVSRVVLLRGAGSYFCAGGDINMFGELISLQPAAREQALRAIVDTLHPLLTTLRQMPKPVVVAAQGAAAGFGLSLVLAADLAIAAEDCLFASGYIHLGTSPDGGMTMTLPRIVGLKRAAELMLLGDRFDARRALELGLVNRLVPPAGLEAEALALATRLAKGPTHGYGRTKALIEASIGQRLNAQLQRETESFAACAASEEFVEGVRAFLEKRRPDFLGARQP